MPKVKFASRARRFLCAASLLSLLLPGIAQAQMSGPPTVEISTVLPDESTNTGRLTLRVSWLDAVGNPSLVGSAICILSAASAELTPTALIFPPLARHHCTEETNTGIIDAALRYYAENPGFQSEVANMLTLAGEELRSAEEIRRGCPNHPTQCLGSRAKIESYRANETAPYSVVVVFSVDESNPANRVTCTFLTSVAELTPVELLFGPLASDICVGDADAVNFLADAYARNIEGFKTEVDICVTTAGRPLHRPEEIERGCPNHPSWCPPPPANPQPNPCDPPRRINPWQNFPDPDGDGGVVCYGPGYQPSPKVLPQDAAYCVNIR